MTQRYDIILDGQMGQRAGTLSWTETDGTVRGTFSLLGYENPIRGTRNGQTIAITHRLRTAVRTLDCETALELCGDTLSGVVTFERYHMKLHGTRSTKGHLHEIPEQD